MNTGQKYMKLVDAHQHFWHPDRNDYGWMPKDNPVLSRQYKPDDLLASLKAANVHQTVLVQAAPSVEETEYLLGIADATSHVAAVVGWINFEDPTQLDILKRLAGHPKFVGVRPMIQNIADDDWMLRDDIQWAYRAICDLDLTLDCLGFPRHLDNFRTILARFPGMRSVIDHSMKPQFRSHSAEHFQQWADGMSRLADDTGAFCKLSGLVTEADDDWSVKTLKPYTDHMLSAFGAQRVMWGSDWPVVRLRCEYEQWLAMARELTSHLSETDREHIFSSTASNFYRL